MSRADVIRAELLVDDPDRFVLVDSSEAVLVVEASQGTAVAALCVVRPPTPDHGSVTVGLWLDRDAALDLARELGRRATGAEHGGIDW